MNEKSLAFHVEVGDYFGTLATVLDLLRQNLERGVENEEGSKQLARLRDDLMHMQDNFEIICKAGT